MAPGTGSGTSTKAFQTGFCQIWELPVVSRDTSGDSHSPLLSVVNVKGDYGDVVRLRYNTVHYLPVLKNYIKTIHTEIKTDRDRFVDFVYRKTIVKLHFRPVQHPLLLR